jgi:hypothetical protein
MEALALIRTAQFPGISVLAQIVPRFKENPRMVGPFVMSNLVSFTRVQEPRLTDPVGRSDTSSPRCSRSGVFLGAGLLLVTLS